MFFFLLLCNKALLKCCQVFNRQTVQLLDIFHNSGSFLQHERLAILSLKGHIHPDLPGRSLRWAALTVTSSTSDVEAVTRSSRDSSFEQIESGEI